MCELLFVFFWGMFGHSVSGVADALVAMARCIVVVVVC